eukprot:gene14690-biopygen11789
MSEIENESLEINDVNGTGTSGDGPSSGRCPAAQQRRPGRHHLTARKGWGRELSIAVMECCYLSKPINDEGKPIRGYRKRMHAISGERQQLEVTEQRLCDQARMIRVNGWLTELELEQIKHRVLNENDEAIDEDVHDVEEDTDVAAGIGVNTNEDDRIFVVHNDDLSDEEIETLNKLNKIIDEHMDEELVFSDDIKMEFGVKKCVILIMHRGAVAKTKTTGIVLPSGETIKHIDEDGYKHLGIVEFHSVKEKEIKEAFATEYFRRVKLVCKSKLNGKNKINALIHGLSHF